MATKRTAEQNVINPLSLHFFLCRVDLLASDARDLLLEIFNFLLQFRAVRLEDEVPVGEPHRVPKPDEFHHLGHDGEAVYCADNRVEDGDTSHSTTGVEKCLSLVLDIIPLRTSVNEHEREREIMNGMEIAWAHDKTRITYESVHAHSPLE